MQFKPSLNITLPDDNAWRKKYDFIEDITIRENIIIYSRYLSFLLILCEEYSIDKLISYSIYKDIILYAAQIAEGVCLYSIKFQFFNNIIDKEILGYEWKEIENRYEFNFSDILPSETKKLMVVIKQRKLKKLNSKPTFKELIEIASKCNFSSNFCKKLKFLSEKRNKIHIGALLEIDHIYIFN